MNFKKIYRSASVAGILFIASQSGVYSGTMGAESFSPMGSLYVGVFGGGGSVSSTNLGQEGTAFYPDTKGGPLAVNAKGESDQRSEWLAGGQIGYRLPPRVLNHIHSNWTFAPAAELEGFYIGGDAIHGADLNNGTTRLTEHDFHVTYPTREGVFLVNAVLNTNHSQWGRFHPYVGIGAGPAVVSISGANSTQTAPSEPSINHYNSGSDDTSIAFAAQPKVGVSVQLTQHTNLFVEYRFLYLSATDFTFGNTVYTTHVATSNWDVKIGSQYYNLGTMGLQFDL